MRGVGLFFCLAAFAQTPAAEVDVATNAGWVDTGIDLRPDDSLTIAATGSIQVTQGKNTLSVNADGADRGYRDLLKSYPVNGVGQGALIARIGTSDTAVPFLIGSNKSWKSPRAGRLYLGINKADKDAPSGSFHVKLEFSARGTDPTQAPKNFKLAAVTPEIMDRIPRRVVDAKGNEGDNSNFVVVGSEQKMLDTFQAAGWVKVDRGQSDAILHGILSILTKEAYVQLPMSELMMFGRVQDYGMAHAEPLAVIAQRHHLRLWKAPFKVGEQELWVGAATHDIGFDRDARNNGVTHKIDPNVDEEREYVGASLNDTGLVAKLSYVVPGQPSKEAHTATGATFHSDGRVLVIHLIPDSPAQP